MCGFEMALLWCFLTLSLLLQPANGQGVFLEHNRDTVPNFGLLLHNMVGRISNDADEDGNLVCRTDNTSCCRDFDSPNGIGFGHWYYPSGDLVVSISQPRATGQIYEMLRADQDVRLRRDNSAFIRATANGIYRCEVPDQNGVNRNRYVGLYSIGAGAVFISQNPQFSLISNDPLEFTLTSTTTGGPLTTANWSRPDNGMVTGDQVLVDGVAATVRHTLSVTGRFPEVYMFSTINVRTNALDTRSITIQAANPPTNLTAAQSGIISVQVSWTAPASGGALRTGYRIFYQTGGSEQSVDAAAGVASRTLTGLLSGMTYNISIESRSNSLPSAVLGPSVVRIRAFEDLAVTTVPSPTSIRVAFAQPSGSLAAESYMTYSTPVSLERVRHCVTVCRILGLPLTCSPFTITDLQEFSSYNIAITVHGLNATHVTNKQTVTFPAAPIAAPQDLSVTVLSTSITFGWDPVACIERNGVIDNYIVRFGPEGGVQSERTVQSGGIDVAGTHTASGLNPFTNYSFEVAAVNSAGTGPFTATLTVVTIGGGGLSSVSIEAIIAAAVVVVLVVLVLTGVFITVLLVLKHRRGAPPHTHEPPTEAAVLSTPSGSAQPISTEPCVAYQTVTSAQQQQQSSTPTPTYPLGQQSCDQPEMPHVCV